MAELLALPSPLLVRIANLVPLKDASSLARTCGKMCLIARENPRRRACFFCFQVRELRGPTSLVRCRGCRGVVCREHSTECAECSCACTVRCLSCADLPWQKAAPCRHCIDCNRHTCMCSSDNDNDDEGLCCATCRGYVCAECRPGFQTKDERAAAPGRGFTSCGMCQQTMCRSSACRVCCGTCKVSICKGECALPCHFCGLHFCRPCLKYCRRCDAFSCAKCRVTKRSSKRPRFSESQSSGGGSLC